MELSITDKAKEQFSIDFLNKTVRIKPKMKTWGGSSYELVLDEPKKNDSIYNMDNFKFIVAKEEEKDAPFLEIDYIENSWGPEYVVTALC